MRLQGNSAAPRGCFWGGTDRPTDHTFSAHLRTTPLAPAAISLHLPACNSETHVEAAHKNTTQCGVHINLSRGRWSVHSQSKHENLDSACSPPHLRTAGAHRGISAKEQGQFQIYVAADSMMG